VLATASARLGDHQGVLVLLDAQRREWHGPLLRLRYALSSVLVGASLRWATVKDTVAEEPEARWIADAWERSSPVPEGEAPLRHALFVEYGMVLLSGDLDDRGGVMRPRDLGGLLKRCWAALEVLGEVPERLVYAGARGEVVARWLADIGGVQAIPLKSRLPGQNVLGVLADDEDAHEFWQQVPRPSGTLPFLQVVKDPDLAYGPAPDVLGLCARGMRLPLHGLESERATDRVPPRLLATELQKAATETAAEGWVPDSEWCELRREHLSIHRPLPLEIRPGYVADIPMWGRLPK